MFGVFSGWEGEVGCFVVVDLYFLQFGLNCFQTGIGSFAQNCYVALGEKYSFK